MSNIFRPHSLKQEKAIRSTKRILLLGCGTQFGKTVVGAVRMRIKLHTFSDASDHFLITAPTYKVLSQSTLPAFLKMMGEYGSYNKKEDVFEMRRGGKVFCRTETDPDSIIGITNVRHIWGDEAGKYRLYFWENIQARADFLGCQVDLTTSPYALNWIYKDLIKPTRAGKRSDVELIQAASWENPYHSLAKPEALAQKRATMDPRRFNMIFGGEWGKMEGLVYDCWDEEQNIIPVQQLPNGTRFVAGVDWGYHPDPFVCIVRAITPDGMHYQVHEFCKTGQTLSDAIRHCQRMKDIWGVRQFYCDPSQPGSIEEFNRNGLGALPADNDINRGIALHYELIKTRRYRVMAGTSPHTLDELETYHYPEPEELGPDDDQKDVKPVGQNDHCLDACRYTTIETFRSGIKHTPYEPGAQPRSETQEQRLKRLMRPARLRAEVD